jgi:hypothetical protein
MVGTTGFQPRVCGRKCLRVFRNRARLFVTLGWVLFMVSIPICLAIGAMAGFDMFYFPARQNAR